MASTLPRHRPDHSATGHPGKDLRCFVGGVPIDRVTMKQAAARVVQSIRWKDSPGPFLIMGPNAQLVGLAQKNAEFAEALRAADLNVPDGISVVLASRIIGEPAPGRVTGGELMERLCRDSAVNGFSVFFLGGLPGAAESAAHKLIERYPGLQVAGTHCPPFGFESDSIESERVFEKLASAKPDLLCVAFGAPKQEIWMHRNRNRLHARAAISVGAALDTQAGLRKRAPRWTHRIGMEWLYRLLAEPRRLWRRYLIGNIYFIYLVAKQILLRKSAHAPST